MCNGIIFDIKEFALNDGPGIRTTVFLKGCPLRCAWCHNPEGLAFEPQQNRLTGKTVGQPFSVDELVARLTQFKDIYDLSGGGVTFSGGEPTAQGEFICSVAERLEGIHRNLDTCGMCAPATFNSILKFFDLVYFDLKLAAPGEHTRFCGVTNEIILKNLESLAASQVPFHIRIPLIPGITDTLENLKGIHTILEALPRRPHQVDLLPYNVLAGGKYDSYGMSYSLEGLSAPVNQHNIRSFMDMHTIDKVIIH